MAQDIYLYTIWTLPSSHLQVASYKEDESMERGQDRWAVPYKNRFLLSCYNKQKLVQDRNWEFPTSGSKVRKKKREKSSFDTTLTRTWNLFLHGAAQISSTRGSNKSCLLSGHVLTIVQPLARNQIKLHYSHSLTLFRTRNAIPKDLNLPATTFVF